MNLIDDEEDVGPGPRIRPSSVIRFTRSNAFEQVATYAYDRRRRIQDLSAVQSGNHRNGGRRTVSGKAL